MPTETANPWPAHYATPAGFRYWPSEELVRSLAGWTGLRALDVGCGSGANLPLLVEHVHEVIGIDPERVALDAAAALLAKRHVVATLTCGSIVNLHRYRAETFDLVVDCMTSQHLPFDDHRATYEDYFRLLMPGGRFFLQHLNNRTISGGVALAGTYDYESVNLFPAAGFTCLPRPSALLSLLLEAGFRDIHCRGLAKEYPDGHQVAHYTIIDAWKAA